MKHFSLSDIFCIRPHQIENLVPGFLFLNFGAASEKIILILFFGFDKNWSERRAKKIYISENVVFFHFKAGQNNFLAKLSLFKDPLQSNKQGFVIGPLFLR